MRGNLHTCAQRARAEHLVDGKRRGNAFEMRGTQRFEFEIALGELVRGLAHENGGGRRDVLHPRRDMNGVANRIVIGVQVVRPNRVDDDFAGVDSDTNLQRNAGFQPESIAMAPHGLLHAQRRIERTLRMILVRDGGAEQGKDAVAERFGDIPFVVVDGLHHQRNDGLDQTMGLFGIEVVNERGRAGHIGEQRGDGLALAGNLAASFHRRLLGADTLGQMVRRVMNGSSGRGADGSRRAGRRARPIRQRRAALAAEFGGRGGFMAAARTSAPQ